MFLASEIGALFAEIDPAGRPMSYFSRQVRAMHQSGAILPDGLVGQGKTAAFGYDYEALLIARIGSQLIDLGVPMAAVKLVRDLFWSELSDKTIWRSLIRRKRAEIGETVYLDLRHDPAQKPPWRCALIEGNGESTRSAAVIRVDLPILLRSMPDWDPNADKGTVEVRPGYQGLLSRKARSVTQNVTRNN